MAEPQAVWIALRRLEGAAGSLRARPAGGLGADGLSASEQARAQGITAPRRRAQFVAARHLARDVLATGWGGDPREWVLSASVDGPPCVTHSPTRATPFVTISHSGEWIGCAAADAPLGMDVEAPARQRDLLALAAAICSGPELDSFRAMRENEQAARFHTLWTLKEAWLKCRAEAATPGRMARIDATPAAHGENAQGRVWQKEGLTLALVTQAGTPLWFGDKPFGEAAPTPWAVNDAATHAAVRLPALAEAIRRPASPPRG